MSKNTNIEGPNPADVIAQAQQDHVLSLAQKQADHENSESVRVNPKQFVQDQQLTG